MMAAPTGPPPATHRTSPTRSRRGSLAELVVPYGLGFVATATLFTLGIATGQPNWQVYLVFLLLGAIGVAVLHLRVSLSRLTIWGLVLFGVGHVAGGMAPVGGGVLYQHWLIDGVVRYDNLQHAIGFGFVGRATWEALGRRLAPVADDRPVVAWWLVVLGASAFGAVNEIVEYVLTLTLESTSVGGYDNTARDLVANLVGGILLGWVTGHQMRRRDVSGAKPRGDL